jgi:hypothetical protein
VATSVVDGDLIIRGTLTPSGGINLPDNTVGDADVDSSRPISEAKLQKRHHRTYANGSRGASPTADAGKVIHVASGPGTVVDVAAGITVAGAAWAGGGQATVDVKKNGTSILSGVVTLNGSSVALAVTTATIATTTYVAGDVFEVVVAYTAGTGTPAQGLFARVVFREDN